MFDMRRALMADWAPFCAKPYEPPTGKVLAFHAS
jgi:hypothetical protein